MQLVIRLLLPPGSLLLDHAAMRPHLGALDARRFTYDWTHPDPRMDSLQRELSRLVEKAALEKIDPRLIFSRIVSLAGSRPLADHSPAPLDRDRPPRLTEPWFCCAEPTEDQMDPLRPAEARF